MNEFQEQEQEQEDDWNPYVVGIGLIVVGVLVAPIVIAGLSIVLQVAGGFFAITGIIGLLKGIV
jgi:hypothetical protein